jgi:hypothetical protein
MAHTSANDTAKDVPQYPAPTDLHNFTQQFKIVLKEARDAKHEKFNMVTKIFLHKP